MTRLFSKLVCLFKGHILGQLPVLCKHEWEELGRCSRCGKGYWANVETQFYETLPEHEFQSRLARLARIKLRCYKSISDTELEK